MQYNVYAAYLLLKRNRHKIHSKYVVCYCFIGWSEDMDATQEQSLFVIGSRAGMKQEEIEDCVQVQINNLIS